MFDALGDDIVDMVVIQRIVDRFAISALFDEFRIFKDTKLMGDGRLVHIQKIGDLVDVSLLADETVKDTDPGRVRKALEQFRNIEQDVFIHFLFHRFFTLRARIALMTAITMTPVSAKIASHILAIPKALRIRQTTLTPMAKMMFS